MFLIKLSQFESLVEATSFLAQISNDADVKFTPMRFYLIVSHPFPHFFATLQLSKHVFDNFSVNEEHSSKVSLESFHDAMLDGGNFCSISLHLLDKINQLILRFETSCEIPPLHLELTLSPPITELNIGKFDTSKYIVVKSSALRRVIKGLPIFHDDSIVCVGVTKYRMKFSIASQEIVLTKQSKDCKIVGYDEEVETQLQIILRPMLFFLNFTYTSDRVWFHKTVNNYYSVMSVPAFGLYGQYVIYFPPYGKI